MVPVLFLFDPFSVPCFLLPRVLFLIPTGFFNMFLHGDGSGVQGLKVPRLFPAEEVFEVWLYYHLGIDAQDLGKTGRDGSDTLVPSTISSVAAVSWWIGAVLSRCSALFSPSAVILSQIITSLLLPRFCPELSCFVPSICHSSVNTTAQATALSVRQQRYQAVGNLACQH
jgi:hypothetical protein